MNKIKNKYTLIKLWTKYQIYQFKLYYRESKQKKNNKYKNNDESDIIRDDLKEVETLIKNFKPETEENESVTKNSPFFT